MGVVLVVWSAVVFYDGELMGGDLCPRCGRQTAACIALAAAEWEVVVREAESARLARRRERATAKLSNTRNAQAAPPFDPDG